MFAAFLLLLTGLFTTQRCVCRLLCGLFCNFVCAVVRSKLERPKKPAEVLSRLTAAYKHHELQFDHLLTESRELLSLTKDQLCEYYEQCIAPGPGRRKIATLCAAGKARVEGADSEATPADADKPVEGAQPADATTTAPEAVEVSVPAAPAVVRDFSRLPACYW